MVRRHTDVKTLITITEQMGQMFGDVKSMLETRPIFHFSISGTIPSAGMSSAAFLPWFFARNSSVIWKDQPCVRVVDIKQDLQALKETHIEEKSVQLAIRSKTEGVCSKVFHAIGMAMLPTIREI